MPCRGPRPPSAITEDPGEELDTFLAAFDNAGVDLHRVPRAELGNVLLDLFLLDLGA